MRAGKIFVEAEQDGPNAAVLTVKDMSMRRRLRNRFGQHNVRLSHAKLRQIGFPPGSMKDLKHGRPVRFKVLPEEYIVLLESVS